MKLLILTQKVDANDDILGFMHVWIAEFAKTCEMVTVICLEKGEVNLPENVKVLSLGKESDRSKIKYIRNFYKYIWQERNNYDKVFVHMNQEYVVLGGLLWKMLGKKIFLWRNHPKGGFFTDLAVLLADKVFCTSKFSYTARFAKTELMPAGIETDYFINLNHPAEKDRINLLFLGRISPIKDLKTLVKSLAIVRKKDKKFFLDIVGAAGERDKEYLNMIKNLIAELKLEECVKFWGAVNYKKTLEFYNKNDIFINLTKSGSLDKTALEAMSCEKLTLVCNESFRDIFPKDWHDSMIFKGGDADDLANKIIALSEMETDKKNIVAKESRKIAIKNHSLDILAKKIFQEIK